jgi:hypothetical protein
MKERTLLQRYVAQILCSVLIQYSTCSLNQISDAVVQEKRVVISNEPKNDPRPDFSIPDPHPPLNNFAGLPLFKAAPPDVVLFLFR